MTTQNRIGKFASLGLIGLGITWIAVITYQVYSPPKPPAGVDPSAKCEDYSPGMVRCTYTDPSTGKTRTVVEPIRAGG
jgi:hypothetical protein